MVVACHRSQANVAPSTASATIPIAAATTPDKIWTLEASGPDVRDTSIAFAAASGRTIVMRHTPPDGAIFLILEFPVSKDTTTLRDSVHVRVHPIPGRYAFDLSTTDKLAAGTAATFSYAIHFRAPPEAAVKYPTPGAFEQVLAPALLTASKVQYVGGTRPAADMLRFPVNAAGSYALVAPK
ncbi:MAG: hypothetical protein ACREK8_09925 [Gemmatimonadales bacterium]